MRKFYFKFFHLVHRHKQEGNDIYRYVLNRQHCLAGKFIFYVLKLLQSSKPPLQQPASAAPKFSFLCRSAATLHLKDSMICLAFNESR